MYGSVEVGEFAFPYNKYVLPCDRKSFAVADVPGPVPFNLGCPGARTGLGLIVVAAVYVVMGDIWSSR
jgi:hypothetical protein